MLSGIICYSFSGFWVSC